MDLTRVILQPYNTEKSYSIRQSEKETLTFLVDKTANKHQIKEAFIAIFGQKPEKIHTINRKPVRTRTGTAKPGFTKAKKIAYVVMPLGVKVSITEEEAKASK